MTQFLIDTVDEMYRRNRQLAAGNRGQAGDDMPLVEVPLDSMDLADPKVLTAAEGIARMGRKVNVRLRLDVSTPAQPAPPLEWFGGSALLRESAALGTAVRLVWDA